MLLNVPLLATASNRHPLCDQRWLALIAAKGIILRISSEVLTFLQKIKALPKV
jgi:hypothetical protein